MTSADKPVYLHYRWRLIRSGARRRHQFRIGVWRYRRDRICPEYRFIAIEWQL